MAFNNDKAIYLQIADRLSDEILAGVYKAFDRIPSVREYAATLGVNANTTRRQTFLKTVLPEFARQMKLLDISWEELKEAVAAIHQG